MSKTILLVEDSTISRKIVANILRNHGYEVIEGCTGDEALDRIKGKEVNLVLCDYNLPGMDGLELAQHLMDTAEHHAVPIVMISTSGGPELKKKAQQMGLKAWMTKPVLPDSMLKTLNILID